MRILFTCTQGAGHFRPLIPYARALKQAGQDVAFASPRDARRLIETAGFSHFAFDRPGTDEMNAVWASLVGLDDETRNRAAITELYAGRAVQAGLADLLAIVKDWGPDVVIRDSLEFCGLLAARAAGVPHARVAVHNGFTEAVLQSEALVPLAQRSDEGRLGVDVAATLGSELIFTSFPESFDGAAPRITNTPPYRVRQPVSRPGAADAWSPKSDRPLVYVTFGTVAGNAGFETQVHRNALLAADGLDIEVLLTTGPHVSAETLAPVPANVEIRGFVPQAQVLQHASAMVCHGGSGTLVGGLMHGVPMLVVPLFADQASNARRVQALGIGLMSRSEDAAHLRAGLTELLSRGDIPERCRAVARETNGLHSLREAAARIIDLAG